jgi:RNA-directed DNA polymerase
MRYYGHVYRSALYPLLGRINAYLVRWIRNKYQRLRGPKPPTANCRRSPKDTPHFCALDVDSLRLVTRTTRAV